MKTRTIKVDKYEFAQNYIKNLLSDPGQIESTLETYIVEGCTPLKKEIKDLNDLYEYLGYDKAFKDSDGKEYFITDFTEDDIQEIKIKFI
jgi:hypothetical protein